MYQQLRPSKPVTHLIIIQEIYMNCKHFLCFFIIFLVKNIHPFHIDIIVFDKPPKYLASLIEKEEFFLFKSCANYPLLTINVCLLIPRYLPSSPKSSSSSYVNTSIVIGEVTSAIFSAIYNLIEEKTVLSLYSSLVI